jgi:hypothetical protein
MQSFEDKRYTADKRDSRPNCIELVHPSTNFSNLVSVAGGGSTIKKHICFPVNVRGGYYRVTLSTKVTKASGALTCDVGLYPDVNDVKRALISSVDVAVARSLSSTKIVYIPAGYWTFVAEYEFSNDPTTVFTLNEARLTVDESCGHQLKDYVRADEYPIPMLGT